MHLSVIAAFTVQCSVQKIAPQGQGIGKQMKDIAARGARHRFCSQDSGRQAPVLARAFRFSNRAVWIASAC